MHSTLDDTEKEVPVILGTSNGGDHTESFHLMQPLVLDEVDVETLNEIAALLNTEQVIAPNTPDLPPELLNLPFTECSVHYRPGNLTAYGQFSVKSHPGRKRAKGGEEKITRDRLKHPLNDLILVNHYIRSSAKNLQKKIGLQSGNAFGKYLMSRGSIGRILHRVCKIDCHQTSNS